MNELEKLDKVIEDIFIAMQKRAGKKSQEKDLMTISIIQKRFNQVHTAMILDCIKHYE